MDPVIQEILRAKSNTIQPHAWRRWRDYLRNVIQPQLDELAQIKTEREAKPRKRVEANA